MQSSIPTFLLLLLPLTQSVPLPQNPISNTFKIVADNAAALPITPELNQSSRGTNDIFLSIVNTGIKTTDSLKALSSDPKSSPAPAPPIVNNNNNNNNNNAAVVAVSSDITNPANNLAPVAIDNASPPAPLPVAAGPPSPPSANFPPPPLPLVNPPAAAAATPASPPPPAVLGLLKRQVPAAVPPPQQQQQQQQGVTFVTPTAPPPAIIQPQQGGTILIPVNNGLRGNGDGGDDDDDGDERRVEQQGLLGLLTLPLFGGRKVKRDGEPAPDKGIDVLEGDMLWKRFTREDYKMPGNLWEKLQGGVGGARIEVRQTLSKLGLGL